MGTIFYSKVYPWTYYTFVSYVSQKMWLWQIKAHVFVDTSLKYTVEKQSAPWTINLHHRNYKNNVEDPIKQI